MAKRGQIILDPAKRTVQLMLTDGTTYATARARANRAPPDF